MLLLNVYYMMDKTKTDLLEMKEKMGQIFNKVVVNPNFVPLATGLAITAVAGIAISVSSGDHSQSVFAVKNAIASSHLIGVNPTKAIFW
jgi:hypothetical protein